MKRYDCILFDADNTLFDFDALAGLRRMFAGYGVSFTDEDHAEYQRLNAPLWLAYQAGTITARDLQLRRFEDWACRIGVPAAELNSRFLGAMAEICRPIDGALELLDALRGRFGLGIITNGFTELQKARLQHSGLAGHFDLVVISEEVGVAKPHPGIFEHALAGMGMRSADRVLMVGDNPHADIQGSLDAGLHACWFNPARAPRPEGLAPHHEIAALAELRPLLSV